MPAPDRKAYFRIRVLDGQTMPRGSLTRCKRKVIRDPQTGREVWQLTDWDADQVATYPYAQGFSGDERYLVFFSSLSGGALFRLEVESGEAVQITDDSSATAYCMNMHPNGREVFYVNAKGRSISATDIYTLENRIVADCRGTDWRRIGGTPSFTSDGRKVCCCYHTDDRRGGVALADVAGSAFEDVFRRDEDIQHVQFRPGPDHEIIFAVTPDYQNNMNLPPEKRARAWKLNCTARRAEPFLIMPPGFRATHEYWDSCGERLYFHKKTVPGWIPNWVCSISSTGDDVREHFGSPRRRLGHSCVSRDSRWLVCDSQDPGKNELYLINLETGAAEVLCWPNASIRNGTTGHVHPSFSPNGRFVCYTSDSTGRAQVYLVPLNR